MKKITKTAVSLFVLIVLIGILSYLVRMIFARNLSIEEYGLFYAVLTFLLFFVPFRDLGLSEAIVYFISKYLAKKDLPSVKGVMILGGVIQFIMGLFFVALFYLLRNFLAINFFKNPISETILVILLVYYSFHSILPAISYIFLAHEKLVKFKLVDFFNYSFILLFSLILFSNLKDKALAPAYSYLSGQIVAVVMFLVFLFVDFKWLFKESARFSKSLLKEMLFYSLPIMFSTAGMVVLSYSDIILLTLLKGTEVVGLYSVAYPSINVILLFILPLASILFPRISKLHHIGDKSGITRIVYYIYNYFLMLCLPLGLMFFFYSDIIITTLFGAKYILATNALRVFSIAFVFMALREFNFAIIAGIGKPKERSKILYIGVGANILLDLLLIPLYGATGAALGTGICCVLMAILSSKIILKDYKAKIDYLLQARIVLSSIAFSGVIFLAKYLISFSNPIFEAILVLFISILSYVGCLFLFNALNKEKMIIIKNIFF